MAQQGFSIRIDPELRRLRAGGAMPLPAVPAMDMRPADQVEGGAIAADAGARAGTVRSNPGLSDAEQCATGLPEPVERCFASVRQPRTRPVRLRRDGRRPLRFDGLPILICPLALSCGGDPGTFSGVRVPWGDMTGVEITGSDMPKVEEPKVEEPKVEEPCVTPRGQLELYLAADGRVAAGVQGRVEAMTPNGERAAFAAEWIADPEDLERLLTTMGLSRTGPTDTDRGAPMAGVPAHIHEPDQPA